MDGVRAGIGPAYVPRVPSVDRPGRASISEARPHPKGGGFVGTYVHAYDPSRQPSHSQIPAMRPAHEATVGPSATPIYDALYSEYRRAFRTLPGDRSGEEDLTFQGFGTGLHAGRAGHGGTGYSGHGGAHAAPRTPYPGVWRPYTQHHVPAALPPAPRKGL